MKEKQLTRGAGILMPITSLPSSYGIGTLGKAAYSFIDLLANLKQSYWQILPIGPTGLGNSPYQPLSAFAGNPYIIDLDDLVAKNLLSAEEIRSYDWETKEGDVDYTLIYNNRTKILKKAFERFDTFNSEYCNFISSNSYWLDDYSLFCALKEYYKDHEWTSWDSKLRDRDTTSLDEMTKKLDQNIQFYKFCQYEFFCQWKALVEYGILRGISIIGDIPLYVAWDSADVWAHRDMFLLNEDGKPKLVSGVPSDAFSVTGQIWGSPIYNWEAMSNDDFSFWKSRIAHACEMFQIVRLDHFIGFVKYYAVNPTASSPSSGKWYKGPGKRLLDAILPMCGDSKLIIDDAGPKTIVPGVKKLIEKSGFPCCKILLLGLTSQKDSDNLPHNFVDNNLVLYTTTHDTETLSGYIMDNDDTGLEYIYDYIGHNNKATICDDIIRLAYQSNAAVCIIPMQDLLKLGNEARINAPSTIFGNWQWRINKHTLSPERCDWIRKLAYTYRR